MNIKRSTTFFLEKRKKDGKVIDKNVPIIMRVTFDGKRADFTTGYRIDASKWDDKKQKVKNGCWNKKKQSSAEINDYLANLETTLNDIFKSFEVEGKSPSISELRKNFNGRLVADNIRSTSAISKKFWDAWDEFTTDNAKRRDWTKATSQKFDAMKQDLLSFKPDISFNDFTDKGLSDFVCWMRDEKKVIPNRSIPDENGNYKVDRIGLKNSTIEKKLGYLRWFLIWATNKGYNTNIAFQSFKLSLKTTQNKVVFLTKDEINKIRNAKIPSNKSHLDAVRDVFLFMCFSGIRYSDTYNLKKSDIKDGFIEITTVKTADSLKIELNKMTSSILDKYSDIELPEGKALPVLSNTKMNKNLKELCQLAEINEPIRLTSYKGTQRIDEVFPKWQLIGTHTGRRTFICNMLSLGVPAEIVMKWTGHSDYSAMKPYIAIVDAAKKNAMSKIDALVD